MVHHVQYLFLHLYSFGLVFLQNQLLLDNLQSILLSGWFKGGENNSTIRSLSNLFSQFKVLTRIGLSGHHTLMMMILWGNPSGRCTGTTGRYRHWGYWWLLITSHTTMMVCGATAVGVVIGAVVVIRGLWLLLWWWWWWVHHRGSCCR